MASIVDICNLALAHLGNRAQVVSIAPVDGSVESDYCARFFPMARDEILEMADWSFARSRASLAQLALNPSSTWSYAYARPVNCLVPRRIMTGDARAHEDDSFDFEEEGGAIFCNQALATLVFTTPIEDPTRFSPGFTTALSYKLAAYLAGPVLRGEAGSTAAGTLHGVAARKAKEGVTFDANRSWRSDAYIPSMVAARGGQVAGNGIANPVIYGEAGYAIS